MQPLLFICTFHALVTVGGSARGAIRGIGGAGETGRQNISLFQVQFLKYQTTMGRNDL